MTARVIDDPSTLGWELDPDTGRWVWVGDGSQGGGTGGIQMPWLTVLAVRTLAGRRLSAWRWR